MTVKRARYDAEFRLAVSACARGGHGKTEFGCTAPAPLHIITVDPNTKNVVRKWQGQKDIYVHSFVRPQPAFSLVSTASKAKAIMRDEAGQDAAIEQWNGLVQLVEQFCNGGIEPIPTTIVIDTATQFRRLQILAEFGKTAQIPPSLYMKPNYAWQNLFDGLKDHTAANIVYLHRLTEEYVGEGNDSKKTGYWVRDGFSKIEYMVDCEVTLAKNSNIEIESDDDVGDRFGMRVEKCTERPWLEGKEWWGRTKKGVSKASFGWLALNVFPESTRDDWGI